MRAYITGAELAQLREAVEGNFGADIPEDVMADLMQVARDIFTDALHQEHWAASMKVQQFSRARAMRSARAVILTS